MLAILDGADRLRVAIFSGGETREFYATWALRSLDRAREYLVQVDLEKISQCRAEYSAEILSQQIHALRHVALQNMPVACLRHQQVFLLPIIYI